MSLGSVLEEMSSVWEVKDRTFGLDDPHLQPGSYLCELHTLSSHLGLTAGTYSGLKSQVSKSPDFTEPSTAILTVGRQIML